MIVNLLLILIILLVSTLHFMFVSKPAWKRGKGIVATDVKIGTGTVVWNHAILWKCEIGKDCIIGSHAEISGKIGNECKIECNAFIPYGVIIEDGVFIGPHVCFTNDMFPRAYGDWEMKPTLVKEKASIGANATILCGTTIGKYAMVGCGATITKNVPDYAIVVGNNRIIGDVRNRNV